MITLNVKAFANLQGELTDTEMAAHMGIGRTQLWRAKNNKGVGQKFISRLIAMYPDINPHDYFFSVSVTQMQHIDKKLKHVKGGHARMLSVPSKTPKPDGICRGGGGGERAYQDK